MSWCGANLFNSVTQESPFSKSELTNCWSNRLLMRIKKQTLKNLECFALTLMPAAEEPASP